MELPNQDGGAATPASDESSTLNPGAGASAGAQDPESGAQGGGSPSSQEATSLDQVGEQFAATAEGGEGAGSEAAQGQNAEEQQGGEAAEGGAEGAAQSGNEEEGEEQGADGQQDESLTDPTKPPPFHEHPRWQELVAERDQLKPMAESYRTLANYMSQNNISGEDLQGMLEIGALMQSNPEEAFKRLEPIYMGLGQMVGRTLPADLEKQVAEGKITPAVATELAKERANVQMLRQQAQVREQQSKQSAQQQIVGAVSGWVKEKQKADLSFKQGSPLWEAVNDRLQSISTRNPPKSPQEAVQLAEQAYADVKKWFTPANQQARTVVRQAVAKTKRVSSNGSSPAGKPKEPTTFEEVAMQATGLRWNVPKKEY